MHYCCHATQEGRHRAPSDPGNVVSVIHCSPVVTSKEKALSLTTSAVFQSVWKRLQSKRAPTIRWVHRVWGSRHEMNLQDSRRDLDMRENLLGETGRPLQVSKTKAYKYLLVWHCYNWLSFLWLLKQAFQHKISRNTGASPTGRQQQELWEDRAPSGCHAAPAVASAWEIWLVQCRSPRAACPRCPRWSPCTAAATGKQGQSLPGNTKPSAQDTDRSPLPVCKAAAQDVPAPYRSSSPPDPYTAVTKRCTSGFAPHLFVRFQQGAQRTACSVSSCTPALFPVCPSHGDFCELPGESSTGTLNQSPVSQTRGPDLKFY